MHLWLKYNGRARKVPGEPSRGNKLDLKYLRLDPLTIALDEEVNLVDSEGWTKHDIQHLRDRLQNGHAKDHAIKVEGEPVPGIGLLTAKQAIQQPLPQKNVRASPRSSSSKTRPRHPRTFSCLKLWHEFPAEQKKVLALVDDSVRRFQPVVKVGDPNLGGVGPADESEVRAPFRDVAKLVTDIAHHQGWDVDLAGNGNNRAMSHTNYLVRLRAQRRRAGPSTMLSPGSQPQRECAKAEQQGAGPSAMGSPGSQPQRERTEAQQQGAGASAMGSPGALVGRPRKQCSEAAMSPEQGTPNKRRRRLAEVSGVEGAASVPGASSGDCGPEAANQRSRQVRAGDVPSAKPAPVATVAAKPGLRRSRRVAAGSVEGSPAVTSSARKRKGQRRHASRDILACIEIKGDWQWDLRPHESLLQKVQECPCLRPALYQVFGDMVMDEVPYGAVTNYTTTIMLKRSPDVKDKVLYVSRPISGSQLPLALLTLAKLSFEDQGLKGVLRREQVPPTPPEEVQGKKQPRGEEGGPSKSPRQQRQGKGSRGEQGHQQKQKQQQRRQHQPEQQGCQEEGMDSPHNMDSPHDMDSQHDMHSQHDMDSQQAVSEVGGSSDKFLSQDTASQGAGSEIVILDDEDDNACSTRTYYSFAELGVTGAVAGHGQYGSVLQGLFGGRPAIIKLFHKREDGAEEAFQHELEVYDVLRRSNLQGTVVPQLLCHGRLSLTDAFFLALSDEGQDLHTHCMRISRGLRSQVMEAVQALHEAGVCHGDVRASNVVQRDDGTLCIVDFERAKLLQQRRTKADLADIKADLRAVEAL